MFGSLTRFSLLLIRLPLRSITPPWFVALIYREFDMSVSPSRSSFSLVPLFWLALGTFAVGTESFMIAGLLPNMAADLSVSVVAAGTVGDGVCVGLRL
jgi:hypothetical protein